jgi:hypothetical protein
MVQPLNWNYDFGAEYNCEVHGSKHSLYLNCFFYIYHFPYTRDTITFPTQLMSLEDNVAFHITFTCQYQGMTRLYKIHIYSNHPDIY